MTTFTTNDLIQKQTNLTTLLSAKMPKGFSSVEEVTDRIDWIHENFNQGLATELNALESVWSDIFDLQRDLDEVEELIEGVSRDGWEINDLTITDHNKQTITVFTWADYIVESAKMGLIVSYSLNFTDGYNEENKGMNAGGYLHGTMNECGVFESC